MTKNQTNFIMSSDRKIVGNGEVITKVDIGSDRRMARARVEINKKLMRQKKNQKQKPLKLNHRESVKSATQFGIEFFF